MRSGIFRTPSFLDMRGDLDREAPPPEDSFPDMVKDTVRSSPEAFHVATVAWRKPFLRSVSPLCYCFLSYVRTLALSIFSNSHSGHCISFPLPLCHSYPPLSYFIPSPRDTHLTPIASDIQEQSQRPISAYIIMSKWCPIHGMAHTQCHIGTPC
jgi:hypothetical protein